MRRRLAAAGIAVLFAYTGLQIAFGLVSPDVEQVTA